MEHETPLRVSDPAALRAFAHPLRLRILSEIGQMGRSNVVGVAERLGEPANSVSYHLSILARHGLVVPAEPPADATRRERWWKSASTTGFSVDDADEESRPGVIEGVASWYAQRAGELVRRLLAGQERAGARGLPSRQSSLTVWLTPGEAHRVAADLEEVLRPLAERYHEQRAAGTLAEGPGGGADPYLFDLTFFPDLSDRPPLRGRFMVAEDETRSPRAHSGPVPEGSSPATP